MMDTMIVSTAGIMDTIGMAVGVAGTAERMGGGQRRRRAWSLEEKQRIVAESRAPGASASVVARRHDVNTNQLFTWRRQLEGVSAAPPDQPVGFVPAAIAVEPPAAPCARGDGQIEIVLASGARVIVGMDVDERALTRVIKALSRPR
jgi:transposase